MRLHSAGLVSVLVCAACESGALSAPPAPKAEVPALPPAAAEAAPVVSAYGAAFEPGPELPLATLLANPRAYADQNVITEGRVQRACTTKGCWMEIGEGDDACRVTFKDYGFFVPTDSAGARARIQGRLDTRVVEAAAVQHLEAEGARFKNKQANGTATEVRLIASAVQLKR
jgi:hypothetical protein